jgi:hypothetical protein
MIDLDGVYRYKSLSNTTMKIRLLDGRTFSFSPRRKVPILYFFDISSISHIKDLERSMSDPVLKKRIDIFRSIDLLGNGISYLPALLEKMSDTKSRFDALGLVEEAKRDVTALRKFFTKATVQEPDDFIIPGIKDLMGIQTELSGEKYHAFLEFANALGIWQPVANKDRFKTVVQLCGEADRLGFSRGHPVVLTSLACIYGCVQAREVMKFKKDPAKFKSSNALGDIQLISRTQSLAHGIRGGRFQKTEFITDDQWLHDLFGFFPTEVIKHEVVGGEAATTFSMSPNLTALFPDLFNQNSESKDSSAEIEMKKIMELVQGDMQNRLNS